MILLEFAIYPNDKGENLSEYVARCVDVIDKSGLPYRFSAMSTIIEGSWDEVMKVVGDCYKVLEVDCNRIAVMIRMDARKGTESRLKSKVDSVKSVLGRELST